MLVLGIVFSKPISYDTFTYPAWATALGWTYASVPALFVPVLALRTMWKYRGHGAAKVSHESPGRQSMNPLHAEITTVLNVVGPDSREQVWSYLRCDVRPKIFFLRLADASVPVYQNSLLSVIENSSSRCVPAQIPNLSLNGSGKLISKLTMVSIDNW